MRLNSCFQTTFLFFFSLSIHSIWCDNLRSNRNEGLHERSRSPSYDTITTTTKGRVLRATINNPPINLLDYRLIDDLASLVTYLAGQTEITVVILSSANPDFWIAHYDLHLLGSGPPPPGINITEVGIKFIATIRSLSTLPIISIAEISGRLTGGANEVAVQCDMRFVAPGARLSQIEVGFGILPGAGGIQFLVSLIGRARAFEYILSGRSVDAKTAAAIGWANTAYASNDLLRREVDALAQRIASFPGKALGAIKRRINVSKPTTQDLDGDFAAYTALRLLDNGRFLKLTNNQTRSRFELDAPFNIEQILG